MPGYQTLPQSGAWRPGGAGRIYVNPQQSPGIRSEQLAVGRNLLPPIQVRNAASLDNQGVGVVVALIGAAATLAATGASIVMQKKAEKKQKALAKKQKREAAKLEAEAKKEEQQAAQNLVAAPVSGSVMVGSGGAGGGINWLPLAIGGGAILLAFTLFGGKR